MNWQRCFLVALAAPFAFVDAAVAAEEWVVFNGMLTLSGSASLELRAFPEDPEFFGQDDANASPSLMLQPELSYRSDDGNDRLNLVPFARWDQHDDHRTHFDLREASWLHVGNGQIGDEYEFGYDFVLGFSKVFWGVAESNHLIDIINQTDLVENVDEEDKLGQPMLNLNVSNGFGTLSLFVLPGFRERTFPDTEGRFRGPLPIAAGDSSIWSGWRDEIDFAGRYSHTISGVDFGVSHFHGTSREPRFGLRVNLPGLDPIILDPDNLPLGIPEEIAEDIASLLLENFDSIPDALLDGAATFLELQPIYDQIDQTSVDIQLTEGSWLLKVEVMTRTGHGDRFYALVGGFEYTFFNLFGSNTSLGLLAEYLYDTREECCSAPPTPYDNDVFMGVRLAVNGLDDFDVLAGAILDVDTQASIVTLEAGKRIGDNFRIEVEGRAFVNAPSTDPIRYIEQDDYISLRLVGFY